MKTNKTNRVAIALALATSAILTGCGSNSSSAPIVTSGVVGANGITGGCIPVSEQIMFSANGIAEDNQGNFALGQIPPVNDAGYFADQTVGSVGIGVGSIGAVGYTSYIDTQLQSPSAPVGEISGTLQLSPGNYGSGYYGYSGSNYYSGSYNTSSNSMTGTISISPILQQQINYAAQVESGGYGTSFGFNGGTFINGAGYSSACVSGVAMIGHLYPIQFGNGGFYAQVYLYLNNLPHGYELYWN